MSVDVMPESLGSSGAFWRGARLSLPIIVAVAPFGVLFGALAVENGLSVFEAVLMSATIYGGASQMVGIELFSQKIAPWMIVFSIFAVNFRHILYSAAIGRRFAHWTLPQKIVGYFLLTDPQYAEAERKAENGGTIGFAWYLGLALPVYVSWVLEGWIGAAFGSLLGNTKALGLDFLLPIYFLGLVMDFRARPLWLPVVAVSALASMLAYQTVGSPWHVSIGGLAGIVLAVAWPLSSGREDLKR